MRSRTVAVGALVLVTAILAIRALRHAPTDEEKISAILDDVAERAGQRDVSGIVEHVSTSFHGGDASLADRDALKGLLLGVLLKAGWARVLVLDRSIEIQGDTAAVKVRFAGLRGQGPADPKTLVPGMDGFDVEARFGREDGTWRATEASYTRLSGGIR